MRVSHAPSRLLAATIPGPEGPLEALLRVPEPAVGAAVMAHPHPLFGGTMHTKVVHAAARLLADRFGLVTARFNFRGVGASAGSHDEGRGEVDDVIAACAYARALVGAPEDSAGRAGMGDDGGGAPSSGGSGLLSHRQDFVLGGFSFGSLCALRAQPRVKATALLLVGIPLDRMDVSETAFAASARVVWVHGAEDAIAPLGDARSIAARAGWDLFVVPEADHLFAGRLEAFEEAAVSGLARVLGAPR